MSPRTKRGTAPAGQPERQWWWVEGDLNGHAPRVLAIVRDPPDSAGRL